VQTASSGSLSTRFNLFHNLHQAGCNCRNVYVTTFARKTAGEEAATKTSSPPPRAYDVVIYKYKIARMPLGGNASSLFEGSEEHSAYPVKYWIVQHANHLRVNCNASLCIESVSAPATALVRKRIHPYNADLYSPRVQISMWDCILMATSHNRMCCNTLILCIRKIGW
jgi:hypothetical protein